MDCYKEFAHIYDKLLYGDIDYKAWSNKIINICNELKINKDSYLDLACGTGNMTKEIGKFFNNVWAVDMSNEMLSEAEAKLRNEKIKAKFVCQDISSLNLNTKFDLVTCVLDSTNYILELEDLKQYFLGVYNHLKDDGVFIFDINSYYKLTNVLGNNLFNYDDDNIVYIWENVLEENIVNMYLTFFIREKDVYRRFDEHHVERAYEDETIDKLLLGLGYKIIKKLDNYCYDAINADTERIAYIVQK
ncbi:dTDP-3-amino-3,4,6-trideoxy-alpha-D-glucopyranose [Clostridium homopropionicum DSM 5847]|uniref:dTDP-3-amino-3,4, 6-trideoxy-alpha-D-glucopyranose n=1 Tax=Clostridium homopropionicum DSM 5847 TaxID=1121318 RepID=A0A0L6ZBR4_9CLOT|nr:class I SAM-dependent methyltransferase [Clostridium homopropionicum]KOA20218.1 dTDP-3-amino-3,4,6-trideoxy-alpha-D-glucopyranose [Clostridium homopropionicum DSM 5847]SFG58727.1 Methyltransferase domain-containing protein [Clostridium homopropionicum]